MAGGVTAAENSAFLTQIVNYVNIASLVILAADYLQTLELEVELIWKSNWGLVKILFLLARYSAFFDVPLLNYYSITQLSNELCLVYCYIASSSIAFGIEISEALLIVRTYALSGNNRKVLIFLVIQYVVVTTLVIVFVTMFLRSLQADSSPFPLVGCSFTGSNILFANFVLVLLIETTVMVLTIWIGMKRYRHSRNPLIVTLYRDGILYFVCLFVISTANVVVIVAGPGDLLGLLDLFQRVMHSIISSRIILQVRDTARGRDAVVSISDLRIAKRLDRRNWYQRSADQSTTLAPTNKDQFSPT